MSVHYSTIFLSNWETKEFISIFPSFFSSISRQWEQKGCIDCSYSHSVFHSQCFTSIVGPNGSGKSNVIDSMLFVFGYRARKIRSKKISVLIHNSDKHRDLQSCTVAVHFQHIVDMVSPVYVVRCFPLFVFLFVFTLRRKQLNKASLLFCAFCCEPPNCDQKTLLQWLHDYSCCVVVCTCMHRHGSCIPQSMLACSELQLISSRITYLVV